MPHQETRTRSTGLEGKRALVTGGGRGIGRAIIQGLADRGARIVIVDRDGDAAETAAGELRAEGAECTAIAGDVTDAAAMEACATRAVAALGGIDILVNNAGIN